uniref:CASP-like protein n=1 Tax=Syphacia muris TaxID=451379 RepID=A0A0N5AB17_9BILA
MGAVRYVCELNKKYQKNYVQASKLALKLTTALAAIAAAAVAQEDAIRVGHWICSVMGYSVEPRVELALRRTLFFSLLISLYLIFGASVFVILPKQRFPSVSDCSDGAVGDEFMSC